MESTDNKTKKIFPFFELPAELREWIYDYLEGDEVVVEAPSIAATLSVKKQPLANIMCVSKQFRREYEHVAASKTTLIYSDHEDFDFSLPALPCRLVGVKIVEIRMFVVCEHTCPGNINHCDAANDLRQTFNLIDKVLPNLSDAKIELKLGLWWKANEKQDWPETPHADTLVADLKSRVETMEQLSRVEIYRSPERCLEADKLADGERLLVTWTKEGGWQNGKSQQPIDKT